MTWVFSRGISRQQKFKVMSIVLVLVEEMA